MTTEEFQQQAERLRYQLVSIAKRYLGNTDEAEDIAQDAMIKLWLMRDKLLQVWLSVGFLPLCEPC